MSSIPTNTRRPSDTPQSETLAESGQGHIDLRDTAAPSGLEVRQNHPAVITQETVINADGNLLVYPVLIARPSFASRFAVRSFDLVVATTALIALAPVMLAVAIAVRLDSPGPVLYGSPRVGHRKPTFKAWKFRSMVPDADRALQRVLEADSEAAREYREFHKLKNDPRLTRAGRFIRQTSLDELPQLINIVRGEMSVVGPRPKACLLYTSPSPRDRQKSRMPSSA